MTAIGAFGPRPPAPSIDGLGRRSPSPAWRAAPEGAELKPKAAEAAEERASRAEPSRAWVRVRVRVQPINMGRRSSDTEEESRSRRKKKHRRRSSSSSSSDNRTFIHKKSGRKSRSKSRSWSRDLQSRSHSYEKRRRHRSSSSSSYGSRRKRSRSHSRGRGRSHRSQRSRSKSRVRRSRSRPHPRSHSRSSERSGHRKTHSPSRERERRKGREKEKREKGKEKEFYNLKRGDSGNIKAGLEHLTPAEQAKARFQMVLEAAESVCVLVISLFSLAVSQGGALLAPDYPLGKGPKGPKAALCQCHLALNAPLERRKQADAVTKRSSEGRVPEGWKYQYHFHEAVMVARVGFNIIYRHRARIRTFRGAQEEAGKM
ncbi:serine/Arginine-related protein 53-like [Tachyglossus aculeatus]|uniref:serine/Arginine-related protein 53-like n=1 Tax=Tachyglossus aculeatus TaxID=9261 RepID=UPI0018F32BE7|nr:serine/Arginine-related protein 53-like [Tachyglossus aculeatus]